MRRLPLDILRAVLKGKCHYRNGDWVDQIQKEKIRVHWPSPVHPTAVASPEFYVSRSAAITFYKTFQADDQVGFFQQVRNIDPDSPFDHYFYPHRYRFMEYP